MAVGDIPDHRNQWFQVAKKRGSSAIYNERVEQLIQEGRLWIEEQGRRPGTAVDDQGNIYEVLSRGTGLRPTQWSRAAMTISLQNADGAYAWSITLDGATVSEWREKPFSLALKSMADEMVDPGFKALIDSETTGSDLFRMKFLRAIGNSLRIGEQRRYWLRAETLIENLAYRELGIPIGAGVIFDVRLTEVVGGNSMPVDTTDPYGSASMEVVSQWPCVLPDVLRLVSFRAPMGGIFTENEPLSFVPPKEWGLDEKLAYQLGFRSAGEQILSNEMVYPAIDRGLLDALAGRPCQVDMEAEADAIDAYIASRNGAQPHPLGYDWALRVDQKEWSTLQRLSYYYGYKEMARLVRNLDLDPTPVRLGCLHAATLTADTNRTYAAWALQDQRKGDELLQAAVDWRRSSAESFFERENLFFNLEGYEKTAKGAYFQILVLGEGRQPRLSDTVHVAFDAYVVHGRRFAHVDLDRPQAWELGQVIEGLQEGLCQVPVGSWVRICIPYALAYGERPQGLNVPFYGNLFYDLHLVAIN